MFNFTVTNAQGQVVQIVDIDAKYKVRETEQVNALDIYDSADVQEYIREQNLVTILEARVVA